MEPNLLKTIDQTVEHLLKSAKVAHGGADAMQYTQAVLNLSHARYAYEPREYDQTPQNAARSSSAS